MSSTQRTQSREVAMELIVTDSVSGPLSLFEYLHKWNVYTFVDEHKIIMMIISPSPLHLTWRWKTLRQQHRNSRHKYHLDLFPPVKNYYWRQFFVASACTANGDKTPYRWQPCRSIQRMAKQKKKNEFNVSARRICIRIYANKAWIRSNEEKCAGNTRKYFSTHATN